MRRLVVAVVALVLVAGAAGPSVAQPGRAAPRPQMPTSAEPPAVILYTFEVGSLIFQVFGHAALCLEYDATRPGAAACFNYGITNYDDGGGLVWGFLRGKQQFWVAVERLATMLRPYQAEDRTIWRQRLPLTAAQARAVEARLWHDVQPEHRYYYYDHFYDNCSTRLRDILDEATGGALREGTTGLRYPMTFREAGGRGLGPFPAVLAIGDFLVGRALSKTPSGWEAMFLPDVLRHQVEVTFGAAPEVVYQRAASKRPWPTDAAPPVSFGRWATALAAIVFALPLLVARWRRRLQRVALAWAMVPLLVWGLLIWGTVLISSIPALRWNEAVLVLMPIDVVIPLLGERRRRLYALGRLALLLLVSLLMVVGVLQQPLWVPILTAFLPMAIIGFDLPHMTRLPPRG
ncbi:MAG: DUF4105 domain-containing protein [Kofleriaceae bacterium]